MLVCPHVFEHISPECVSWEPGCRARPHPAKAPHRCCFRSPRLWELCLQDVWGPRSFCWGQLGKKSGEKQSERQKSTRNCSPDKLFSCDSLLFFFSFSGGEGETGGQRGPRNVTENDWAYSADANLSCPETALEKHLLRWGEVSKNPKHLYPEPHPCHHSEITPLSLTHQRNEILEGESRLTLR